MTDAEKIELVRLRRENNMLKAKLRAVSNLVHTTSTALYELEFGITDGIGDLHTSKENQ